MKKYLFGLGAMLVGAGLMFVLIHGEVRAEGDSNAIHCKIYDTARTNAWVEVIAFCLRLVNILVNITKNGLRLKP